MGSWDPQLPRGAEGVGVVGRLAYAAGRLVREEQGEQDSFQSVAGIPLPSCPAAYPNLPRPPAPRGKLEILPAYPNPPAVRVR